MKIHVFLWAMIALLWGMNACKSLQPPPPTPEITNAPATTLHDALTQPKLTAAAAVLDEPGPQLHAVLTEASEPQFAFQIHGIVSTQEITDGPQKSLLAIYRNGDLAIFGLNGWHQARTIPGGYDIWFRGDAVTCTIYSATTGHTIRVCTRKMRGQAEHDDLVEFVMRYVPPAPMPGSDPITVMGPHLTPKVDHAIVTGPIWGLRAQEIPQAQVVGRNP